MPEPRAKQRLRARLCSLPAQGGLASSLRASVSTREVKVLSVSGGGASLTLTPSLLGSQNLLDSVGLCSAETCLNLQFLSHLPPNHGSPEVNRETAANKDTFHWGGLKQSHSFSLSLPHSHTPRGGPQDCHALGFGESSFVGFWVFERGMSAGLTSWKGLAESEQRKSSAGAYNEYLVLSSVRWVSLPGEAD